jgi:hypothetical protein
MLHEHIVETVRLYNELSELNKALGHPDESKLVGQVTTCYDKMLGYMLEHFDVSSGIIAEVKQFLIDRPDINYETLSSFNEGVIPTIITLRVLHIDAMRLNKMYKLPNWAQFVKSSNYLIPGTEVQYVPKFHKKTGSSTPRAKVNPTADRKVKHNATRKAERRNRCNKRPE